MSECKVLLLDADGVLVIPPRSFSEIYCEKHGVDITKQQQFYSTKEFKQALLGKFDLKEAIAAHNDLWHWSGDFSELIEMWLDAENYPNQELLKIVNRLRKAGVPVYLATQQEKYRAKYLQSVMFKEYLDGMFCSCYVGANKHDELFWKSVLKTLQESQPDIQPHEIVYFDDKQAMVDAAKASGIDAWLYTEVKDVADLFNL